MNTKKGEIKFPLIIDDDYDPITVSINKIPVATHAPNPDTYDDGMEELYAFVISDWSEEPPRLALLLARIKEVKEGLTWDKCDDAREGYDTIVIANIGYVARKDNEIVVCAYDNWSAYTLFRFEVYAEWGD